MVLLLFFLCLFNHPAHLDATTNPLRATQTVGYYLLSLFPCRSCLLFEGSVCSAHLQGGDIIYNRTGSQPSLANTAVATLTEYRQNLSSDASELMTKCLDVAEAMVCHSVFPFCTGPLTSRKLCKNTCDHFRENGSCDGVIDWDLFPDVYQLILSNCDEREFPGGEAPECVHVALFDAIESGELLIGKGELF